MKTLLLVAVLASAALIACTGSSNSAEESPTPTPVPEAAQLTSPTPCPTCPEPTPCPEETPCPTCPVCPEPIVCPQCPDPSAVLSAHLESETCTGHKLYMELEEHTGVDAAVSEEFFWKNCQGVPLLGGSVLANACASAGMVSLGASVTPGRETEAFAAATLIERYCTP